MSVTHSDVHDRAPPTHSPARAFWAFADPELKRRWFANPGDWDQRHYELDFRVGGREVNSGGDRGRSSACSSALPRIVEHERIVFAYDLHHDERLLSVSLTTVEFLPTRTGRGCRSPSRARSSTVPTRRPSASTGPGCCWTPRALPGREGACR